MDVGEISSNKDLYEKVYIRDITKWFFCAKKIPLGYHMIKLDFWIVVSNALWEQIKVLGFK